MIDRYLTTKQVAELLSIRESTVRVWLHRGLDIPHVKIHSVLRFPQAKLERWLAERENERARRNFER